MQGIKFNDELKGGFWDKNGRVYICSCGAEALAVEFPKDEDPEMQEFDFCNIAIWETYHRSNVSFYQRLRYCWRILKRGHPYTDMICLNKSQVRKLTDYMNNELNKK